MKHYFVENPVSGKNNKIDIINELIIPAADRAGIDYEVYSTTERGDGIRFVKEKCEEANGEPVRFYAVGGDGTLYEVVNGVAGYENAQVTVIPKGSGNDYIRLYGDREQFLNVDNLIDGIPLKVDAVAIEDGSGWTEYAINQASMGFDAETTVKQSAMKKVPGAIGHVTYLLAGLYCMFTKVYNDFRCVVDGKEIEGPFVFAVGACSRWYGSGIPVAPYADPTDGKLDFVIYRRLTFWPALFKVGMIDWQQKGTHVLKPYVEYIRGDKMELIPGKSTWIQVDGECRQVDHVTFAIAPKALTFVLPKDTKYFEQNESGELSYKIEQGWRNKEPLKTIQNKLSLFDLLVNKGIVRIAKKLKKK